MILPTKLPPTAPEVAQIGSRQRDKVSPTGVAQFTSFCRQDDNEYNSRSSDCKIRGVEGCIPVLAPGFFG
jgi:hypothetical protein